MGTCGVYIHLSHCLGFLFFPSLKYPNMASSPGAGVKYSRTKRAVISRRATAGEASVYKFKIARSLSVAK